jgi:uncharacterized protein with PQ loop repeat
MIYRKRIAFLALLFYSITINAQKPTEVPKPSDKPIDLSNPADIIIYIILPLCAVLFFFIWRGKKNKSKK